MKTVTRRLGLRMMAGGAAAAAMIGRLTVAAPNADPALAAIAKHRQAAAAHLASIYALDDAARGTESIRAPQDRAAPLR